MPKNYLMENMRSVVDFKSVYTSIYEDPSTGFTWSSWVQPFSTFNTVGEQIQKHALYVFNPESKSYERLDTNKLAVLNNGKFIRFGVKSEGDETQLSGIKYVVEDMFAYLGYNKDPFYVIWGEELLCIAFNDNREFIGVYYNLPEEKKIYLINGIDHPEYGIISKTLHQKQTRFVSVFKEIKRKNKDLEYYNMLQGLLEDNLKDLRNKISVIESFVSQISVKDQLNYFSEKWKDINPALRFYYNEERFKETFMDIYNAFPHMSSSRRYLKCVNLFLTYAPCKNPESRVIDLFYDTYSKLKNRVISSLIGEIDRVN